MAEEGEDDDDDVETPAPRSEVVEVTIRHRENYRTLGSDSESESDGILRPKTPEAVNKLMLQMAVLNERLKDLDLDSGEEDQVEVPGCLGTKEDRTYLAGMLRRFARDDLADRGDGVEAAVRMHVQTVPMWKKWLYCFATCGLWIFLRPHDDTGVLILTKKGRVITYGKSQQAHPNSVGGFLFKTLLIALVFCLAVTLFNISLQGSGVQVLYWMDQIDFRSACIVTGVVALLLLALYLYSNRPRPDCGSSYRQHFAVNDLCAAVYAREDVGGCCARRKSDKLKLCFTKFYPDEVSFATGLPPSAPNANTVGPVAALPSAMAGDSAAILQEKSRNAEEQIRQSGGASAIGQRTATFLAILSTLAALYDYLSMLNYSVHLTPVCLFKVKGCSWKIPNSKFHGKKSRIEGALLPWDPAAANCDSDNNFCDFYLQPSDFCSPENREYVKESVTLTCEKLPSFFESLKPEHLFEGGISKQDVKYVVQKGFDVEGVPTPRNPFGGNVHIMTGLVLKRIGSHGSYANAQLAKRLKIDFKQVQAECESGPTAALPIDLEEEPEVEPLYGDDCDQLQSSCLAETWSPETIGWWPPNRLIDLRFERAVCMYASMPVWITNRGKRIWREHAGKDLKGHGFGCHGEALKQEMVQSLTQCHQLCEVTGGCNYAFYGQNGTASCVLYSQCPERQVQAQSVEEDSEFVRVTCGEEIPPYEQGALRTLYLRPATGTDRSAMVKNCRQDCHNQTGVLVQCNAFAILHSLDGLTHSADQSCVIFGPSGLRMGGDPGAGEWKKIPVKVGKVVGIPDVVGFEGSCFARHLARPDRKHMGVSGSLWEHSAVKDCSGCFSRGVSSYYLEFPNLVTLFTQIIGVFAFLEVVRRRRDAAPTLVAFSGKPEIVMAIVRDPANPSGFDEKETAFLHFLKSCWALRERHETTAKDVFEMSSDEEEEGETVAFRDQLTMETVECQDFDTYDLVDSSRNHCYVDKRLLGIEHEKITAVWNETQRHSFVGLFFIVLTYAVSMLLLEWLVPDLVVISLFRLFFQVLVPGLFLVHAYFKLRSELQCLCVSTDSGRVVQLSRNPPSGLGLLCPHFYGGTDVRLDNFMVGKAIYVQLDMPLKPLWADYLRSGCGRPWRRGVVTVRGDHGLLQIRRTNGEATVPYKAMAQIIESKKSRGLKVACLGTAEIFGISMKRDLLLDEEELIWEWKLNEVGHFTDPFNYTSLLAITDTRLHIARARSPKPMSLRGLLLGPRTFGFRCMHLQEFMGHHAGLTITSLAHRSLESYATTRSRAPPFWPGFGPPIDGFGFVFMPKFSQMYLAALSVTQKPYGLQRHATVDSAGIRLKAHMEQNLKVIQSDQPSIPKGARVVAVVDPEGEEIEVDDARWSAGEGAALEAGTKILLEAVDHQWNTMSDEPWVSQLRSIMDIILGRQEDSGAGKDDVWDILEEAPPKEQPNCWLRLGASLFGIDMMGLHHSVESDLDIDQDSVRRVERLRLVADSDSSMA